MHHSIERELPIFLLRGSVAWMRPSCGGHIGAKTNRSKVGQRYNAGDLTVLLANMIES